MLQKTKIEEKKGGIPHDQHSKMRNLELNPAHLMKLLQRSEAGGMYNMIKVWLVADQRPPKKASKTF